MWLTSTWTKVEFTSLLSRKIREKKLTSEEARAAEAAFESTLLLSFELTNPSPLDFLTAQTFIRSHDSGLRAGDAMHLAIAHNRAADKILTLDQGLLKAGAKLGILPVSPGIAI